MIYFDKVTKSYGDHKCLDDITFAITKGEFVSVVGRSGAGKTTIVKLLSAEERPTSGTVFFQSADVHDLGSTKTANLRRQIGIVFQDFRLLPHKTVFENVAFAMEIAGRTDEDIQLDVPHVISLVGLTDKEFQYPHQLSGGERQRLAIARAIVNQPEVLVADEPTGNLDPISTGQVIEVFKKINELGTTVILTTHDKGVVDSLRRRVLTLEDGRIVKDEKEGTYEL